MWKRLCITLIWVVVIVLAGVWVAGVDMSVIYPKGRIAIEQRDLFVLATLLMLIVVIPVFLLTLIISWRYRANNPKAKYTPDHDHNIWAEVIWWGIPFIIIVILGSVNWVASYKLDPYKPLAHKTPPLKIQVVALDWKWLFIYPEEKIATVNFLQFPADTPLDFEITADAPMNSFWIPELGGQIFAMPGMRTELHLIADTEGEFRGVSANLSGRGFSEMTFVARASSRGEYKKWVRRCQLSRKVLDTAAYEALRKPSENNLVQLFSLRDFHIFNHVIMHYMHPKETHDA
ncbi:MAG: ubiquinol oxidase subunit II [Chlamydiae bacterium RIFCSPHIGHO2_12_FULL_49_11]|nr:MAG: ubiquinol oxidase subunit II [Chlamydiae bacterium RIFCSPHIGHO2_12_FULL_49_11]